MEYLVEGTKYVLNYPELKEDYLRYKAMTDVEFVENVAAALHFVCIVSYFKGTPGYVLLSDEGLVHQMVHLLNEQTRMTALAELPKIREQFDVWCALV